MQNRVGYGDHQAPWSGLSSSPVIEMSPTRSCDARWREGESDRADSGERTIGTGRLHSSGTGVVEPDADASYVAKAIIARRVGRRPKRSSATKPEIEGLGVDRSLRRPQHAGHGRTGSGLRDASDSEAVALVEGNRSRVGRLKEGGAVISVDAHQALLQ